MQLFANDKWHFKSFVFYNSTWNIPKTHLTESERCIAPMSLVSIWLQTESITIVWHLIQKGKVQNWSTVYSFKAGIFFLPFSPLFLKFLFHVPFRKYFVISTLWAQRRIKNIDVIDRKKQFISVSSKPVNTNLLRLTLHTIPDFSLTRRQKCLNLLTTTRQSNE